MSIFAFGATAEAATPATSPQLAVPAHGLAMPLVTDVQYRRGRCRRVCTRRAGRVHCRVRGNCRRWDRRSPRPRGCFQIGPVWYCP
jgi:hypothetical protein